MQRLGFLCGDRLIHAITSSKPVKPLFAILLPALLAFPAEAGVWAHYPFDTGLTDTSGNARHGDLVDVGTPGNSTIVSSAGDSRFGGGAMNFSAERDFINIPSKTFASGTPYTIAFWARKTAGDTGDGAQWDMVIGERDSANFFIALGDSSGPAGLLASLCGSRLWNHDRTPCGWCAIRNGHRQVDRDGPQHDRRGLHLGPEFRLSRPN